MKKSSVAVSALALSFLAGCVTQPQGPMIPVMPGKNKSFSDFQRDDGECRDFAAGRVAGRAQSANDHAIFSAIIGAGLGAALGGAVGGGRGAGIGAASGGVVGSAVGANQSAYAQGGLQRQYDMAYAQCMTAKGNNVTGWQRRHWHQRPYDDRYGPPPPPDSGDYPPPPPTPNN